MKQNKNLETCIRKVLSQSCYLQSDAHLYYIVGVEFTTYSKYNERDCCYFGCLVSCFRFCCSSLCKSALLHKLIVADLELTWLLQSAQAHCNTLGMKDNASLNSFLCSNKESQFDESDLL